MENPNASLISVIVPIYNVDKYIRKCLDSLRNQSLKQIEVICIDDGSTDTSGQIAEEYVEEGWPKFRVYHTEHKGLSAARNLGIENSLAKWIMFVDSDDWVDKDYCRIPYQAAIDSQADMVIFRSYKVSRFGKIKRVKHNGVFGVVDELTANKFGGWAAWNRIYKHKLFENIRYPEGMLYEDFATTHKLVHMAKKIFLLKDYLYYYYTGREDSITHTRRETDTRDGFLSARERYSDFVSWGLPTNEVKAALYARTIAYLARTENQCDDELYHSAKLVADSIIKIPETMRLRHKIAIRIWKIDCDFFHWVNKMVRVLRLFHHNNRRLY